MRLMRIVKGTGKFVLNRGFGIMTERQIQYASLSVGKNIRTACQNGAELKESDIKKIIDNKSYKS